MKLSRSGTFVIAALCLVPCAHAEPRGNAYATVKAIVDYCGRIDDDHRGQYVSFGAQMLASIGGTGNSADYQATYDAVMAVLKQNSASYGRSSCEAGIGLNHPPLKARP